MVVGVVVLLVGSGVFRLLGNLWLLGSGVFWLLGNLIWLVVTTFLVGGC